MANGNTTLKNAALRLGFSACGIARADEVDHAHAEHFRQWIRSGGNATMDYMSNYEELRLDPRKMHPGTKSIICVALNYYPERRLSDSQYQFAYYAYGKDYHDVMRHKLRQLASILPAGDIEPRICVDTAPILERYWAQKAGIGWIGRNRNLIIPGKGSFFILGEILTDIELEYDSPLDSQCGDCHLCTSLCPALQSPDSQFRAEKCWSYQTIEKKEDPSQPPLSRGGVITDDIDYSCSNPSPLKGEVRRSPGSIPSPREGRLGGVPPYIYGCDRCQLICPHNRNASPTTEEAFQPKEPFLQMTKAEWHNLSIEKYRELFNGSAVRRAKYEKLLSNLPSQGKNEK